ncbi:GNAT family N-acetyltransferase [Komagataeibacter sp. AV436]|uniref:GNAT family N-acetyltransferase n=1 Tax=Komagataeibacter melomenusus TaxID=2766578 RepID=A0ABX2ACR6_9PROT|nr:GNAT family N-acetyltransferase [Komagataeibacter melomenusus]MBV1830168.1 GNAT family N-acetyltransferase [Komagataeibacter melomenusus]NPC65525.1 GNAT family N-acetyltransferase [Komagataeibacter melomenusus]
MTFSIRPARPEEAGLLPAIERSAAKAFLAVPALAWLAQADGLPPAVHAGCIAHGLCWVAVDGRDQPVGFLSARQYGADLHVLEISVAHPAQGRGLGRSLLAAAHEGAARLPGLARITLTTFRTVGWNGPFYARAGFRLLPPAAQDARLAGLLRDEEAGGFPIGSRCAMVRDVILAGGT